MSAPSSVLTPYKPGLFSGKGVIVTGGGTGLGYAIGKSRSSPTSIPLFQTETSQERSIPPH